jgi:NAD(P)-dependent dehydrogenase (short-subunit alcohol dehydrogenase family)
MHGHDISGQVALVMGAAGGIGRVSAQAFAAQGLKVVVSDLNAEGGEETVMLIRQAGGEATFIHCNAAIEGELSH